MYASSIMKLWAYGPPYQSGCWTGGSRFSLFITVDIVFTFYCSNWWYYPFCCCNGLVRRLCFISVYGTVWRFFLMTFPIVISYISALFLFELIHILPWHGENMLFLLMFLSGETCCCVTACSHWPLVQHHHQTWSHRRDLHFATWGIAVATHSRPLRAVYSLMLLNSNCHSYTVVSHNTLRLGGNFLCQIALLAADRTVNTAGRRHGITIHHNVYSTIFYV